MPGFPPSVTKNKNKKKTKDFFFFENAAYLMGKILPPIQVKEVGISNTHTTNNVNTRKPTMLAQFFTEKL